MIETNHKRIGSWILLAIRIVVGYLLVKVGAEIFKADQMKGYYDWLTDIGFPAPVFWAKIGKVAEIVGGISLILGFKIKWLTIPSMIAMLVITFVMGDGSLMGNSFLLFLIQLMYVFIDNDGWRLDKKLVHAAVWVLILSSCIACDDTDNQSTLIAQTQSTTMPITTGFNEEIYKVLIAPVAPDTTTKIKTAVRDILIDSKQNYWFATEGQGLFKYDGHKMTNYSEAHGLCSNYLRTIVEDTEGNILITSNASGLCKYNGHIFSKLTVAEAKHHHAAGASIVDTKGQLWFDTKDGLYKYKNNQLEFIHLPIDTADLEFRKANPYFNQTAYSIYSMMEAEDQSIWIGTETKGVYVYDGKSFKNYRDHGLNAPIRSIYQDKNKNIWLGTNANGVIKYDGHTFTNITDKMGLPDPDFKSSLKRKPGKMGSVFSIVEDKDGLLWFASLGNGVFVYDIKNNTINNYTVAQGLTGPVVMSLEKDLAGHILVGTNRGINRFIDHSFVPFLH